MAGRPIAPILGGVVLDYSQLLTNIAPISLDEIAGNIFPPKNLKYPAIKIIIAPCRSGSNALCVAFAQCGYRCYSQPIKSILRSLYLNKKRTWQIPDEWDCIVIKETFGPFVSVECNLDPITIFEKINYPKDKLTFIALFRNPLHSFSSWRQWWPEASIDNFIKSYLNAYLCREKALLSGVPGITIVYDLLKGNDPSKIMNKLFRKIEMIYYPSAIEWKTHPNYGSEESNIQMIRDDPEFITKDIFNDVNNSRKFQFVERKIKNLKKTEIQKILDAKLMSLYKKLCIISEEDLDLRY